MDAPPTAAATHVAEWMLEAALGTTSAADAFAGMAARLRHQGVQIDRALEVRDAAVIVAAVQSHATARKVR